MRNVQTIKEMLMAATFEVFEKMFYIFSEPLDTELADPDVLSSIRFAGPASGKMRLFLSRGVAAAMTENMLGLDRSEITHPILADCVKECTNIICGNFVRKFEAERTFHLSIPSFEMISEGINRGPENKPSAVHLRLAAREGNIEVELVGSGIQ